MGGGDLNLKKSWHPSTRANLEKVYLAEQEAEKEKKRYEELQREKKRERDAAEIRKLQEAAGIITKAPEKLDWMYSHQVSQERKPENSFSVEVNLKTITAKENADTTLKRWDVESKLREDPILKVKKSLTRKNRTRD